jgi:hypothetical protein
MKADTTYPKYRFDARRFSTLALAVFLLGVAGAAAQYRGVPWIWIALAITVLILPVRIIIGALVPDAAEVTNTVQQPLVASVPDSQPTPLWNQAASNDAPAQKPKEQAAGGPSGH